MAADATAAREKARAWLAVQTDANGRVPLSEPELDVCLDDAAIPDADGRLVDDPDWAGAWDRNYAAGRAWDVKASRVATDFSFSADDASYSKDTVMAKCLDMAQTFYGRTMRVLPLDGDRTFGPMDSPNLMTNWNAG